MDNIIPTNDNNVDIEDDYYDYLPADHPLYQRLQNALEEQLKKEEEELRLKHKEKLGELKKVRRTREDIGVTLYNQQQQYAHLQGDFDERMNKLKVCESQRLEIENTLRGIEEVYKNKLSSVKEQDKMSLQASEELNQLNRMLKYVTDYNEQIKSEIQVTTTVAYQVENKTKSIEDKQKKQDYLIDNLLGQIAAKTETKYLFVSQLKQQQSETIEANEYLLEATKEIDIVRERKKSLLKDWDKSIVSMRTRDKALQVVRENILEQEGEKLKFRSQNHRYRELIQKEVFTHNELTMEINKTKMKQKAIENQIKDLKIKTEKLMDKRNLLNNTTNNTKNDIKFQEQQATKIRNEIELIEKNKLKLFEECRVTFEKNLIVLSTKETHEKQTDNLIKQNYKVEKDIFDLKMEIDMKENEIARVEIDHLNVETQNDALKKKIQLMNNEITKLENEFSKKEFQIKKNHEDLEKKQLKVDHLNKGFGDAAKHKGGEDEGLFELKIKELSQVKENLNKEIQDSENTWIQKKTILVAGENTLNGILEECVDGRSKKTILEHKKFRLEKNIILQEKDIMRIEVNLKNLRYSMNRYNSLLDKNITSKDKLHHKYFDIDINFADKLQQMETDSVKLEIEIEVLREEKSDTLSQILEVERQIYLWERKINLEEQMQKIIKPEKGLKDIDEMRSNIHRQELVYNALKRKQEQIIKNMEMAVDRRDFIKVRYPVTEENFHPKKKSGGNTMLATSGNLNRDLQKQKDDLKFIQNEKRRNLELLEDKREEWDETRRALNQIENDHKLYQEEANKKENSYYGMKLRKNSVFCQVIQNQKATLIIEEYMGKRLKVRKMDDIKGELYEYQAKNEQTLDILKNIRDIYPMYSSIIDNAINI